MYVNVNTLPQVVRDALESAKYGKSDIRVEHVETVTMANSAYGDGYQAFTILVDMNGNRYESHMGSWGGANMFNRDNSVDLDETPHTLPSGAIVIKGQRGGGKPVSATIYASRYEALLPIESVETLNEDALYVLSIYRSFKSGYRKEYLEDKLDTERILDIVDGLCATGHLKRNKAGATQITTKGKNSVEGRQYWSFKL